MESAPMLDPTALAVGSAIRAARQASGKSVATIASLAGVSVDAIDLIEKGQRTPKIDTLMRIAFALGLRVDDLLPEDYSALFNVQVIHSLEPRGRRAADLPASASASGRGASAQSSSSRSSDLNSARKKAAAKKAGEQRKSRTDRKSREGGFTTTPFLPAETPPVAA